MRLPFPASVLKVLKYLIKCSVVGFLFVFSSPHNGPCPVLAANIFVGNIVRDRRLLELLETASLHLCAGEG